MSITVLIVDDNPAIRRAVRYRIEADTNWQCREAENGRVAVELVKTMHPDCVVLDWQMPVMSGLEAAQEISRISPKTKMVLFTLHNFVRLNERAQQFGISAVLSKDDGASLDRLVSTLGRLTATQQERNVQHTSDDQAEEATRYGEEGD